MKKLLVLIVAFIMLLSGAVVAKAVSADTIKGDFNGNGEVSLTDVILMSRAVAGWDGYALENADLNSDGIVNVEDLSIENKIFNGTYVEADDSEDVFDDDDVIIFGFYDED